MLSKPTAQTVRKHLPEVGFVAAALACIWLLYGVQGNAQDVATMGTSAIKWMMYRWSGSGGDLSHCWIIPLVSAALIWMKLQSCWSS